MRNHRTPVATSLCAAVIAWSTVPGCQGQPTADDPNANVPMATSVEWKNWSRNLVHKPAKDGTKYYFSPTNRRELKTIVQQATKASVNLRVSGQRHSQTPLVADDNRNAPPLRTTDWLIDLSCYSDLGPNGTQNIVVDPVRQTVKVNAGVREDELDAVLLRSNLMLKTVTAGGFFSIGGMTAVDVHGATLDAPIFAETAIAFDLMGPDGHVVTVDGDSPPVSGWSQLQFARVSLGALGVVTSVTLEVVPRPWATSLSFGRTRSVMPTEAEFVHRYQRLLAEHDRLESFYNPYNSEFLVLTWDQVSKPEDLVPNVPPAFASACTYAEKSRPGAPFEGAVEERLAQETEEYVQLHGNREEAKLLIEASMHDIERQARIAAKSYRDLWLTAATRVVFMSYFLELPSTDATGLSRAWKALRVVADRLASTDAFLIAGPMEFRFVRGGNTALAGTYTTKPNAVFVNLDLLAFAPPDASTEYSPQLLEFFAAVERQWVSLGGWPHHGKMYGFYDPTGANPGRPPFTPAFLKDLARRRGERVTAFERFRSTRDPNGLFCNEFLRGLSLCQAPS